MSALLNDLRKALPERDVPAVEDCATKLYNALPRKGELGRNTVMVAYGGGKDSAYAVNTMELGGFGPPGSRDLAFCAGLEAERDPW